MDKREQILELACVGEDETLMFADGFDDALLGYSEGRVVYDRARCIRILEAQGMSLDEAEEFFSFNVEGAYIGEQTPLYVETLKC